LFSNGEVPIILEELFKNNSINLKNSEKEIFANFLSNYQNIFSENIVAGNYNVVEYVINIKDFPH